MTQDKFTVVGDQLAGRGLTFDISAVVSLRDKGTLEERLARFAEIAEAIYLQGRASMQLSWDDRFDLRGAVETLRALAVIVGGPVSERHRRVADSIERMLHEQQGES